MKNKVVVDIAGSDYTIVAEESQEYILRTAGEVDASLREMLVQNPKMSISMAAVLCCINFCDKAFKASAAADNLRSQMKIYLEDSARFKSEAEDARRENARLANELQTLRAALARAEANNKG